ncbi:hypothetical protein GOP47_0028538 [Adiantum capillus-veneris]|nr:hypothetical protein GOP47_0028538 [Adiantum capillus-veneris]
MPGAILVDEKLNCPLATPPQYRFSPSMMLSPLRHYIPVLTGPPIPECSDDADKSPSQPSLLRRPNGICLNVNALPDMYEEDGSLYDSDFLMQLSPASAAQFSYNGASPTTLSALSALRQFLPSNFDKDGANALQYDMYSGDEFRIYEFKVRRCMSGRSHDWTECPFAHPGERARRRDPRRYHYSGVVCADYKKGSCKKGDSCDMAHGVFECWLHPTRYRTQPCKDGRGCRRRICFFAHTPDQLRLVSPASSSLSSSPSSAFIYSTSAESSLEAFDLSGCLSPLSESLSMPVLSSPRKDAFNGPSLSPRSLPFNLSPSISPISSPHAEPPSPFNRSPATMPTNSHMLLERQSNLFSLPGASLPKGSKTAAASQSAMSLAATNATQKIEDLVRLLRQVDLVQHRESISQEGRGSMPSGEALAGHYFAQATPATRRRHSDEMTMKGGCFFDDDEDGGEPRLERVESGKGLRAQIFESLLSSANVSGY